MSDFVSSIVHKCHINVVCVMATSAAKAEMTDGLISPTLMARAGTGGNQLPIVCIYRQSETGQATADEYAVACDARGNGTRDVTQTLVGGHMNRITDYTTVVIIDHSRRHYYQPLNVVPTMEAHMGTGGGNVPMVLMNNDKTL